MAHILVLDDDVDLASFVRSTLVREGHTVAVASNGRAGLEAMRRMPADLVLTDIYMPEMDGIEVILELTAMRPGLPVVAMSGGGALIKDALLDDAGGLGAVSTLAKPFGVATLRETVKAALGEGGG